LLTLARWGLHWFARKDIGAYVFKASECRSGQMLPTLGVGGVCTKDCSDAGSCPQGMQCDQGFCLPRGVQKLGDACSASWECATASCLSTEVFGRGVCTKSCASAGDCGAPARCAEGNCVPPPTAGMGDACRAPWDCTTDLCTVDVAATQHPNNGELPQSFAYCTTSCPTGVVCPTGYGCRFTDGHRLCVRGAPDSPHLDLLDRATTAPNAEVVMQLLDLFHPDAGGVDADR
jgi:hypothetical protein